MKCPICQGKLSSGLCRACESMQARKKAYWEAIYKHVDPFGDGEPIEEFVVYCDKECFEEIWESMQKENDIVGGGKCKCTWFDGERQSLNRACMVHGKEYMGGNKPDDTYIPSKNVAGEIPFTELVYTAEPKVTDEPTLALEERIKEAIRKWTWDDGTVCDDVVNDLVSLFHEQLDIYTKGTKKATGGDK